jgi:hypothetical protein
MNKETILETYHLIDSGVKKHAVFSDSNVVILSKDYYDSLCDLAEENRKLINCLRWYVDNDDTNENAYNKNWLDGKRRAMLVLGMEVDDD